MEYFRSNSCHHVSSPFYAVALARTSPKIRYLGVESGGRGRRHLDVNLLRPGFGGEVLPDAALTQVSAGEAAAEAAGAAGAGAPAQGKSGGDDRSPLFGYTDGQWEAAIAFRGDREIAVTLRLGRGDAPDRETVLLTFSFAPDISSPSLWARPVSWERMPDPLAGDPFNPRPFTRYFHLPGLVSLPEYGLLRIESDGSGLLLRETLHPDLSNAGMNLGFPNVSGHTLRRAFHHGRFEIAVIAKGGTGSPKTGEINITLTVPDEIYPDLPGCDFTDPRWAGLKRCWMNNFTLNPPTLSLGDNPILDGLGHLSIHWKSDVSVHTPQLLNGLSLHDFFRNALELTFTQHTDERGKMTGYGWENGACNLLALCAYVAGSGDLEFARRHLATVQRVIEFNLALDCDADGILEASYHGNHFRDPKTSLNWWDAFAFGHKDAYGNLVYYSAFRRVREVLARLAGADLGALLDRIDSFLDRFPSAFHDTFFNPETGVYAGWISRDGRVHDYMFTFITAMAVNEGVAPADAARGMMQRLLDQLEKSGYGEYRFGVPGPAIPVAVEDRSDWGPMADWGRYENGGFCGQTAYHFLMALYRVGMREQADRILFSMLHTFETMPTHSGLTTRFTESWDWRTRDGEPCGYNYLADNYVFLLAAVEGHFGVEPPGVNA